MSRWGGCCSTAIAASVGGWHSSGPRRSGGSVLPWLRSRRRGWRPGLAFRPRPCGRTFGCSCATAGTSLGRMSTATSCGAFGGRTRCTCFPSPPASAGSSTVPIAGSPNIVSASPARRAAGREACRLDGGSVALCSRVPHHRMHQRVGAGPHTRRQRAADRKGRRLGTRRRLEDGPRECVFRGQRLLHAPQGRTTRSTPIRPGGRCARTEVGDLHVRAEAARRSPRHSGRAI
jgi:hypothetical protein